MKMSTTLSAIVWLGVIVYTLIGAGIGALIGFGLDKLGLHTIFGIWTVKALGYTFGGLAFVINVLQALVATQIFKAKLTKEEK